MFIAEKGKNFKGTSVVIIDGTASAAPPGGMHGFDSLSPLFVVVCACPQLNCHKNLENNHTE